MKDPAFLFYSSDFLAGTMLMSDEQVGKYIRLLCYQHMNGHISEEDMKKICKTYDKDIFSHFTKDEEGNYYNQRLEDEIKRRKDYSESRRKNRSKKQEETKEEEKEESTEKDMNNICLSYDEHMGTGTGTGTGTENITETKTKKETKKKYGEYKHVLLTDKELQSLENDYVNAQELITYLDEYIEMKGYKAKNHYLCIKKWVVDAVKQKTGREGTMKPVSEEFKEKVAAEAKKKQEELEASRTIDLSQYDDIVYQIPI